MRKIAKVLVWTLWAMLAIGWATVSVAQLERGFSPLVPTGPHVSFEALDPSLTKWYLPQELYREYNWKSWEYSNYAKEPYSRYTNILLEGTRFYDLYGNYVTRGWELYDWTEEQPSQRGSQLRKSPEYSSWFNNVLISSASKGQFYTAVTIGDVIRTTLTPLTFSKPSFNGIQWDFLTDKYAFTALASRIGDPTMAVGEIYSPGTDLTGTTRFFGLRGTVQLGDFAVLGGTYVNAHHANSALGLQDNSLKGILTEAQLSTNIEKIVIRLSDDSPEDGGGAALFSEEIWIDSGNGRGLVRADIEPTITGGLLLGGLWQANGAEVIDLTYDIKEDFGTAVGGDYKFVKNVEFRLVLANDYKVEVTSDVQLNARGEEVYLLVTRAPGNVKDGSNQRFVRFQYGLPTGNEIYGLTFEVNDLKGFNLRAEVDINRRFRRYPNRNYTEHPLAADKSSAFYVTASQVIYPWFLYGEAFGTDEAYSTSMYLCSGASGDIDYESEKGFLFEFVDDNDDQDRFPDWDRKNVNQAAEPGGWDTAVFPGLDENNDLISDFNQNDNLWPDYAEPFLKYNVDPPEFLFGMDMNNNTVIDRFENDNEADYPYKRDHRGYNLYGGVEIVPGIRLTIGRLNEWLLSKEKESRATYGMFTLQKDFAGLGRLQIFDMAKRVRDDIPDHLYQWEQPPLLRGEMHEVRDLLLAQNTFVNTAYLRFDYIGISDLNFINKLKYEIYDQRGSQEGEDTKSFGAINKADYSLRLGKNVTVMPKWKSMYRYSKTGDAEGETKELSEIFFLILKYRVFPMTWLELGYEGTLFRNYVETEHLRERDYLGNVLGIQFSNSSDYLGYLVTNKIGFRWERLEFENLVDVNTMIFIRMYAGMGE